MASCNDFFKKKKTNKAAKSKQSKLDVRREQWLSQGKDMEVKVDSNRMGQSSSQFLATEEESRSPRSKGLDSESSSIVNSNLESQMSSPFGSSISSRCFSAFLGEADGVDSCLIDWEAIADDLMGIEKQHDHIVEPPVEAKDGIDSCLDDWEAIADALLAEERQHDQTVELPVESKIRTQIDAACSLEKDSKGIAFGAQATQAWQPDDASRPRCLPNLKQHSLAMGPTCGASNWAWQSVMPSQTSCPICYEDLDLTDSSFLPCPCGFRLCLFCHNRILEADERCPGCRKQYEPKKEDVGSTGGATSFLISRSFGMTA